MVLAVWIVYHPYTNHDLVYENYRDVKHVEIQMSLDELHMYILYEGLDASPDQCGIDVS